MYLTQLLLPLPGGRKGRASRKSFREIRDELVEKFGGVTAYVHSPAEGDWVNGARRDRDTVVVIEVMTKKRERRWWRSYRKALEARLAQEYVIARTTEISLN